jgi:hypothetical protein
MKGLEWMLDIKEPKILREEDGFNVHLFCKIKTIYHRLPSGTYGFTKIPSRELQLNHSVETTKSINMRVSKNRVTSSSTTFRLW